MTLINELVVEFLDVLNTLGHRLMGGPLSALCKTYFEHDPLFYEYQAFFLEEKLKWQREQAELKAKLDEQAAVIAIQKVEVEHCRQFQSSQGPLDSGVAQQIFSHQAQNDALQQTIRMLNEKEVYTQYRIQGLEEILDMSRNQRMAYAIFVETLSNEVAALRGHVASATQFVIFEQIRRHGPSCPGCEAFQASGNMCTEYQKLLEHARVSSGELLAAILSDQAAMKDRVARKRRGAEYAHREIDGRNPNPTDWSAWSGPSKISWE
jgi:hypothetical protein